MPAEGREKGRGGREEEQGESARATKSVDDGHGIRFTSRYETVMWAIMAILNHLSTWVIYLK